MAPPQCFSTIAGGTQPGAGNQRGADPSWLDSEGCRRGQSAANKVFGAAAKGAPAGQVASEHLPNAFEWRAANPGATNYPAFGGKCRASHEDAAAFLAAAPPAQPAYAGAKLATDLDYTVEAAAARAVLDAAVSMSPALLAHLRGKIAAGPPITSAIDATPLTPDQVINYMRSRSLQPQPRGEFFEAMALAAHMQRAGVESAAAAAREAERASWDGPPPAGCTAAAFEAAHLPLTQSAVV